MIKITFVIPYDEIQEEVYSTLTELQEEGIVYETTQIIGTEEVVNKQFDSDIIIARGVTYLALRKSFKKIPVVEIVVTGYDVIRAIDECKRKYNPKKIAIIGSETMIFGAESLKEIMNIDLELFKVEKEEEALDALEIAKTHNVDAIVGGLMTYTLAKKENWQCVWIKTGKEAIRQAIREAINAANVARLERAKAELFKIILENAKEAIIAVDKEGAITAFNKSAYKTLNISKSKEVMGMPIKSVLPQSELLKAIEKEEEEIGVINNVNGTMIVSNRVPIRVGTQRVGSVITFQNVDTIQAIESKIRKELSNKGLTAKYSFGNIVGSSQELSQTIQIAYKYSQVDSNILLIGETGTGKELFAQSIHNASNRNLQPFIAINCAALPENLLESELFGYVEGAFSGAVKGGKIGLFQLAHKGTIFLDEVGEIPMSLQAKLLRVLQEKEIRQIGDDKVVPIDVRIISATNIDFNESIKNGKFRQDLLYRLNVLNLNIPPLRERNGDIKLIAKYFIQKYCKKFNKDNLILKEEALQALSQYNWPGNIRELRNICERLVVLSDHDSIEREHVLRHLSYNVELADEKKQDYKNATSNEKDMLIKEKSIEEVEKDTIIKVMEKVNFNKTEAAKILGISRTTLWRKLK